MHQPYANYPIYQPPTIAAPEYLTDLSRPVVYREDSFEEKSPPAKKESRRGRSRNHYTPAQKEALEKAFLEDGIYVPIRKRDEMAKELNLTSKQVKIWYQNRRQKDKRREIRRKGVMKVPMCADSPDSGVPETDEPQYPPVAVKPAKKPTKSITGMPTTPPVYSYLSNAPPQYPAIDYSQPYPNYYNYDYLPAPMFPSNDYATATNPYALHQYFQYMSGFSSQYSSTATETGSAALPVGGGGGMSQMMTNLTTGPNAEPQSSFSAAYWFNDLNTMDVLLNCKSVNISVKEFNKELD